MVYMKKFLVSLVAVLAVLATCVSCNDTPWGIEYSLLSTGKTDGNVKVDFVNGDFYVAGEADYRLNWSNAPADKVLSGTLVKSLDEALGCQDPKTLQAAEYVNSWLDESIKVVDYAGHYDVYVKGYVKETKTQITFSIDRHFTNIEE